MSTISKTDITREAARIAALWNRDGDEAAKQAFQQQCDAWQLRRWEALVLSDAVHVARAGAAGQRRGAPLDADPTGQVAHAGDDIPSRFTGYGDASCNFCDGPMPCYCAPPADWDAEAATAQDADARDRVDLPNEVRNAP